MSEKIRNKYEYRHEIVKVQSCLMEKMNNLFCVAGHLYKISCDDIPMKEDEIDREFEKSSMEIDMIARDLIHCWHWLENLQDRILKEI